MRLLYICKYQFAKKADGVYALPAYGNAFWQKYLDVFEGVDVLAENVKGYLNNGTLTKITDDRIKVTILPENTNPKDFKNDKVIKNILQKHIKSANAILIKPANRKGIQAIEIAKNLKKPYMIELTGDLNMTLKNHKNPFKRLYGPVIHWQIIKAIKDCKYGLYVTEKYLQKIYPIVGKQCGCTDTHIPDPELIALSNRLAKINNLDSNKNINIGMVASYHDNRKGIDTAIEALERIHDNRIILHILGLGTEDDRKKWYKYSDKHGVRKQIVFDPSLSEMNQVLAWNDEMDIIILPSRSEGLPRCIVESLSRACPCVLSNVCGMPELVNEKWLHKPGDSIKLAELLIKMIQNPQDMIEAANENFERSHDFTQSVLKTRRNNFLKDFLNYASKQ